MLGLRHELADRHVFDHAPAQRADGLVGHGGAPVLSEVVEHLDLRTGRFHRLRLLIITRAAPQAPYRERFSPLAPSGGKPFASLCPLLPAEADISPKRRTSRFDPERSIGGRPCCDAQRGISYHGVVGCDPRIEGST